jgi:hypothetical protein
MLMMIYKVTSIYGRVNRSVPLPFFFFRENWCTITFTILKREIGHVKSNSTKLVKIELILRHSVYSQSFLVVATVGGVVCLIQDA